MFVGPTEAIMYPEMYVKDSEHEVLNEEFKTITMDISLMLKAEGKTVRP